MGVRGYAFGKFWQGVTPTVLYVEFAKSVVSERTVLFTFMPYKGVPKELTSKMDKCVKMVMKDGKEESDAIEICRTSIMSSEEAGKVDTTPYVTVASKQEFSSDKIDASKAGTIIKNIEIFKAGIYRQVEWKKSALDKMVANFYHLKATKVFPNVPVRANHPGWGGGDIHDVGGYVSELRRNGKTLVADIRVVDEKMKEGIESGKFINRSAEIGTYDDNEGNLYTPTLFGFAWVDIPQVEGLSPVFSYRSNKDTEIINLTIDNEMEIKKEVVTEAVVEKDETVEVKTEVVADPVKEEVIVEKTELSKEFSKAFPAEFAELAKLKENELNGFVTELTKDGKLLPAQKDNFVEFTKSLTKEQYTKFETIMKESPKLIELDKDVITEVVEPTKVEVVETPAEKASKIIEETK